MSFFLQGVAAASGEAERSIFEVANLIPADRKQLLESPKAGPISDRPFKLSRLSETWPSNHVSTAPVESAAQSGDERRTCLRAET